MNNREKIISAIEKAKKQSEEYAQDRIIVPFKEADMILALLKEQEPIEPITSDGDDLYWQPGDEDYACGACGEELAGSWWVYCPYCGRKVKWDD